MKCIQLSKTSNPTDQANARLQPMSALSCFEKFAQGFQKRGGTEPKKVATLGSDSLIYLDGDNGILSAVLTAYNNHWKLRTSPDDWWFCVTKRVASAIDRHGEMKDVRNQFVEHEGKKELIVDVETLNIYEIDYELFFEKMSHEIRKHVKVPEYVDAISADFSTTTPVTKIVSQITVMSSLKHYFRYTLRTRCGIPAIEMLGKESDWLKLGEKLKALKRILQSISKDIGLTEEWWSHAEKVFKNLVKTYQGSPDKKWWDKIIRYEGSHHSGDTPGYVGWLPRFIEGTTGRLHWENFSSGLLKVPLKLQRPIPAPVEDDATLIAGMLGFTLHEETVPIVQPYQGWSLLLPENSPFRSLTAA